MLIAAVILVASYLFGAVPFGYLIARAKGVDLFKVGSGNIGATNVGRAVGRKLGVVAFVLDFLKGAIPVGVARAVGPTTADALGHESALWVLAGLLAFLGHIYPIYLKFKGGKGVATGAGVVAVLVPVPFAVAALAWVCVTLATRYVSAGSVAAAVVLAVTRLMDTPTPFAFPDWIVTAFCLVGGGMVVVKHRSNLKRLMNGTENQVGDGAMRHTLLRALHLLAVGLWCGSGFFFIYLAATPIFEAFRVVVNEPPGYRTAGVSIVPEGTDDDQRKRLGSALAGTAVAPLFPRFFVLSAICAGVAVATAEGFRRVENARVQRMRLWVCIIGAMLVAGGWPLSVYVAGLNERRFTDPEALRLFNPLHGISLMGSAITTVVAAAVLAMGAKLPTGERRDVSPPV